MDKQMIDADGYIVYDDDNSNPFSRKEQEIWFATYDEAIAYATALVDCRAKNYKECLGHMVVTVYKGNKEMLYKKHNRLCERIVFHWSNYKVQ